MSKRNKIPRIPALCLCGCNEVVWCEPKKQSQYIFGHHARGNNNPAKLPESRAKISKAMQGRTVNWGYKIGKANIGNIPWNKGKKGLYKASEETKKKMSEHAVKNSGQFQKGHISWSKLNPYSSESKKKMSDSHKGKTGERCPAWKGGTSFLPYCPKFNNALKEKIRERDNRTCQLCGVKENGRKLDVHHVSYDKPNCYPHLIALCSPCHKRVNGNRDYWEGLFMNKLKERGLLNWC